MPLFDLFEDLLDEFFGIQDEEVRQKRKELAEARKKARKNLPAVRSPFCVEFPDLTSMSDEEFQSFVDDYAKRNPSEDVRAETIRRDNALLRRVEIKRKSE